MRRDQAARPNQPRKHHYLPKSYLARFTDTSTLEGRLHVLSLENGKQWQATPTNVGHQRDFYRLEGIDDGDEFVFERLFGEVETAASEVIRQISETKEFPEDNDQFSYLMNFLALLAARVPRMRENFAKPLRDIGEMILQIELSSREQFEHVVADARRAGHNLPDIDYEEVKHSFEQDKFKIEISQGRHLQTLVQIAETILPLLAERHWTVLQANDGEFVVSDHPVSLLFTIPKPPSFYGGPGFGIPGTDVTVPLTKTVALLGRLEDTMEEPTVQLDRPRVASINSRTLMYANRIVCSSSPEFVWETRDGKVASADELAQYHRARRNRTD